MLYTLSCRDMTLLLTPLVQLQRDDVLCLYTPGAELYAQIIQSWVLLLKFIFFEKDVYFCNPTEVRELLNPEAVGPIFFDGARSGAKSYLLPVHVSGIHWILVVVACEKHRVHIYDSLIHPRGSRDEVALKLAAALDRVLGTGVELHVNGEAQYAHLCSFYCRD